jgi:hypothetical protein
VCFGVTMAVTVKICGIWRRVDVKAWKQLCSPHDSIKINNQLGVIFKKTVFLRGAHVSYTISRDY